MKRLLAAVAVLTLGSTSPVFTQQGDLARPAAYPPYGFRVFTDWQPAYLRLDVSPDDAQVFVDAGYAGHVDDFNGGFHRLRLAGGPHLVTIRKPGFTTLVFEVAVFPGQGVTFARTMQRAPVRDAGTPDREPLPPAFEEGAFLPAADGPSGALRLDVKPKDAEVYADGLYVGLADDFSNAQHLMLTQGTHHLSFVRDGYEPLEMMVMIRAERPDTFHATLKKP